MNDLYDLEAASDQWPHKDFSKLFTRQSSKILKSNVRYKGWFNAVMYLAPGTATEWWLKKTRQLKKDDRFPDLCPHKTSIPPTTKGGAWGGCFGEHGENCIFTTGQLALPIGQLAMIKRTILMIRHPQEFMALLEHEVNVLREYARKGAGVEGGPPRKLAVRLNGTSDIRWETNRKYFIDGKSIMEHFPDVTWYDYTKLWERFLPKNGVTPRPLPKNYSLTFSSSEINDAEVEQVLRLGGNAAVVFDIRPTIGSTHMAPMVKKAFGYRVIDGDMHDLRFKDPKGVIVGLRAKGALRRSVVTGESMFVRYITETPEYVEGKLTFHPDDPLYPYGPAKGGFMGQLVQIGTVRGQDVPRAKAQIAEESSDSSLSDIDVTESFPRNAPHVGDIDVTDTFPSRAPHVGGLGAAGVVSVPLNYGTLPSWEVFEAAYEQEIGDRRYKIKLGRSDSRAADGTSIGDGDYTARELYQGVGELVAKFDRPRRDVGINEREAAGSLAATILETLGIEWI